MSYCSFKLPIPEPRQTPNRWISRRTASSALKIYHHFLISDVLGVPGGVLQSFFRGSYGILCKCGHFSLFLTLSMTIGSIIIQLDQHLCLAIHQQPMHPHHACHVVRDLRFCIVAFRVHYRPARRSRTCCQEVVAMNVGHLLTSISSSRNDTRTHT